MRECKLVNATNDLILSPMVHYKNWAWPLICRWLPLFFPWGSNLLQQQSSTYRGGRKSRKCPFLQNQQCWVLQEQQNWGVLLPQWNSSSYKEGRIWVLSGQRREGGTPQSRGGRCPVAKRWIPLWNSGPKWRYKTTVHHPSVTWINF